MTTKHTIDNLIIAAIYHAASAESAMRSVAAVCRVW
jgi:hypothetical protein